jgi:hypothetical protein
LPILYAAKTIHFVRGLLRNFEIFEFRRAQRLLSVHGCHRFDLIRVPSWRFQGRS